MDGRWTLCCLIFGLACLPSVGVQDPQVDVNTIPLERAHAHNDYRHQRPLWDALQQGFCSLEADVFLVDGKLLVAHERSEPDPQRTLESLYLKPLKQQVEANQGKVFQNQDRPLTLLVDIKADGEQVYPVLDQLLSEYGEMLSRFDSDGFHAGAVTVVLSGDRPFDLVAEDSMRWAFLDGRLDDLSGGYSPELYPLISDRWTSHFKWRGEGEFPAEEKKKLESLVQQAHQHGQRIRFWATPETRAMWKELLDADVDLINTDDLEGLSEFLRGSEDPFEVAPKPKQTREFWPNYALPRRARLIPGGVGERASSARGGFQFAIPQPQLDGHSASDLKDEVLDAPLPPGDFTLETLLVHHVNQPVGVAIFTSQERGREREGLRLIYRSPEDRAEVELTASDVTSNRIASVSHRSDGDLAFKKYWYHIVLTRRDGRLQMTVNGQPSTDSTVAGIANDVGQPAFSTGNLNVGLYAPTEPHLQVGNVVKWIKLHDRALQRLEVDSCYRAARAQVESGIKYPRRFQFSAGPYLNYATKSSINLLWESSYPCRASVHFGTSVDDLTTVKAVPESSAESTQDRVFIQEVTLDGLQPDTQYFYNVKLESLDGELLESGPLTFKTAVNDDQDFMFAAFGDTETRPNINDQIAKRVWEERPNFAIHLGDLTDGGKQDHKWQWNFEYFAGMNQLHSRVPVFPVAGNGEGDLYWYKRYHALPNGEAFYKFRYGNAEFFMLNSNERKKEFQPDGRQYQWLDQQLGQSTARWKFVAMHHAPYSPDEDDYGDAWKDSVVNAGDPEVKPLIPLFEKHGVDIVFFGHLHTYGRLGPIRDQTIDQQQGVTYIQTGGGGGNLEDFGPTKNWFSQKLYRGHHYCLLNVSRDRVFFKMYDIDGQLRDYHEFKARERKSAAEDSPAP